MNAGAKAIMITPSDTKAIVPSIERARKAGILVIALDTPLDPPNAADATFATDNVKAGELIGEWAAKTLGDKAKDAHVAYIDALVDQPSVDRAARLRLLQGLRHRELGLEAVRTRDRQAGRRPPMGQGLRSKAAAPRWRRCCRRIRASTSSTRSTSRRRPAPTAALKAAGKDKDAIIVSVDGGCPGVKNVAAGVIGATAQQYPLLMASLGVEAAVEYAKTGKKPAPTPGLDFFNTGVSLVTDKPVEGVPSISTKEGLAKCWG